MQLLYSYLYLLLLPLPLDLNVLLICSRYIYSCMTWILRNDFEWGWQIVCIHLQVHGQIVGSGRVNWGALTSSTSLTSVIWGDVRTRRAYPCNMSRKTSLLYTYSNVYRRIDCIIDIYLLRILRMRTKITKTRHDYPGYKDLRHVHVNDYGIITLNWMLYRLLH